MSDEPKTTQTKAADDAAMADLLERSGPRTPIPSEDLAQIVRAAEEVWLHEVAARRQGAADVRRGRRWALAASVTVALVVGWFLLAQARSPGIGDPVVVATVDRLFGEVLLDSSSTPPQLLEASAHLVAGARLATGDRASGVSLRLSSGASLRLDRSSRIALVDSTHLRLEVGAIYYDGGSDASDLQQITVETSAGQFTDIGTQFSVRVEEGGAEVVLQVREGLVELTRGTEARVVAAGRGLALLPEGVERPFAVAPHAESWNWVIERSPELALGGRSVDEVLAWVSQETGLEVVLPEAAAALVTEVVRGSVRTTEPLEAARLALQTLDLDLRVDTGRLIVVVPEE